MNFLFVKLISQADSRFSSTESEEFFKNAVLKHSCSRAMPRESQRNSTPRARKRAFREIDDENEHEQSINNDDTPINSSANPA